MQTSFHVHNGACICPADVRQTGETDPRPRVVIIGAGFGGLSVARKLAKADVRVTLVDRRNHHLFQPLLYQVATAGLAPNQIVTPIRTILRKQTNAEVLLGTVTGVDVANREVMPSRPAAPFRYQDFGALATVGRKIAIADFGKVHLRGFIGWLTWCVAHIYFLIGFRNRFSVALDWAWSYLTFERGARLITGPIDEPAPTAATTDATARKAA